IMIRKTQSSLLSSEPNTFYLMPQTHQNHYYYHFYTFSLKVRALCILLKMNNTTIQVLHAPVVSHVRGKQTIHILVCFSAEDVVSSSLGPDHSKQIAKAVKP
ncbi:hypothetical protein ATANTOWER_029370, partial [Ataeniobius toweri]|nr:hypothetical protein [Ataeniobius toweri]